VKFRGNEKTRNIPGAISLASCRGAPREGMSSDSWLSLPGRNRPSPGPRQLTIARGGRGSCSPSNQPNSAAAGIG